MKNKLSFPSVFTVLFIVLALACVLTYIIPAGLYSKLTYDSSINMLIITDTSGNKSEVEATQEMLNSLGVSISISKFLDGSIQKAVSIPNTYKQVKQNPQGLKEFLLAPIQGVYDTIDIALFVFILGGIIGIMNYTGAFNAGIFALSKATKGKEFLLIIFIAIVISLGGTTFGLAEETIALYPVLIPIFLVSGYDVLVCIATVYMASCIGTMFATINPFSMVIASNVAGISFTDGINFRTISYILGTILTIVYILVYANRVKKDPYKSLVYEQKEEFVKKFNIKGDEIALTFRFKLLLFIFVLSFLVLVYGVSAQGWWFNEMTALFLVVSFIIAIFSGMKEKEFVNQFIIGAADLLGVALIIGVARSINVILENGMTSDTILYFFSNLLTNIDKNLFIILVFFVYIILGFFIPSTSGLAVFSIPIMAPLADTVGINRDAIISAYIYGQGLMAFITPTGLILASLALVNVTYNKWLKLVMPFIFMLIIFAIIMLLIQVNFS